MAVAAPKAREFRGHVDFFGFHAEAGGVVFGGWVSHALADEIQGNEITARFSDGSITARSFATFYPRDALGDLGIGMVLVVPAPARPGGSFVSLAPKLPVADAGHTVTPTPNTEEFAADELRRWTKPLLHDAQPRLPDAVALVLGAPPAPAAGAIDVLGFSEVADSWLACGWICGALHAAAPSAAWQFGGADRAGGVLGWHQRDDVPEGGIGFVALLPGALPDPGQCRGLVFTASRHSAVLHKSPSTRSLQGGELLAAIAGPSARAWPATARDSLLSRLSRQPYAGIDTLDRLADRVLLEIDQTILCPPHGLALIGWTLAAPGVVQQIRLCREGRRSVLDLGVRLPRPDVIEAVGRGFGYDDIRCGFIAFDAQGHADRTQVWLEVETTRGELGHKTAPAPALQGLAAIRSLLADCDMQFADVAPAFDRVLGPAITSLNAARLRERPSVEPVQFGAPPAAPDHSVVIPLYGRLDFMEAQAALIARDPEARRCEVIYVLDDPPKRREAENLAWSISARFDLPLTLIVLGRNLGFAPASNIGLAAARGRTVCFLNSDVFPTETGWLGRLAARLDADPGLGMVGPLLLHDDGTVQHQGMAFLRQPRYGDWYFGVHRRLAKRPPSRGGLHPSPAITGACMMLNTKLARGLNGFDESYVVGDFEDTDLCLRAREAGYACAVDLDVRLCHLGGRSQVPASERWRMNLTLYNAWLHQRRWREIIHGLSEGSANVVELVE